jgi:hypothetical protein
MLTSQHPKLELQRNRKNLGRSIFPQVSPSIQQRVLDKLEMLDASASLKDVRIA